MKLAISFDDTGSMSSVRKEVRSKINDLVDELFQIYSNLKIAIFIHNDYCNHDLLQSMDFSSNKDKIKKFVNRDSSMGGGDSDEAYAYVIRAMNNLVWNDPEGNIAILIGDALPHEKGYRYKSLTEHYSWREEVKYLKEKNVLLYPIQALGRKASNVFYDTMATIMGTPKLDLTQFAHITQYITAILHKQKGTLETYKTSYPEFSSNLALKTMFNRLTNMHNIEPADFSDKLELLSRFQVCDVTRSQRIKNFVEDMGLHYKAGRGFYQLVNPEIIQENKEVLFVDKVTGEVNTNTIECRKLMGLPYGTRGKINPKYVEISSKYDIFVQSNSYTRNLDPNTKFLYELNYV